MKVCLLDAYRLDDPALVNSHWVAERTAAILHLQLGAVIEHISGKEISATAIANALDQQFEGYAYFGHGRAHLLYRDKTESGTPIPLLGIEQVERIGSRWFHAFACLSGQTLCTEAANAGAAAYLGYRVPVILEWDTQHLPDELSALLKELVTIATLALAQGNRSRDAIRRRVREVSDRFMEWMDIHWEACSSLPWIQHAGLQKLANQLHQDLVLEGSAVAA